MQPLHVGIVAPQTYAVPFTSTVSILDLTTVSACSFEVKKPDGTTTSWSTSISGATTTSMTATHSFSASPSEIDQAGTWKFRAKFTVPGGFRWSDWWHETIDPLQG